jgi:hypothetical protein
MRTALACFAVLAVAAMAAAQSAPIHNQDVIKMVKGGLSESVIIEKINASATEFDTSADGLVALGEAKVPDSIIKLMIDKSQSSQPSPAATAPAAATPGTAAPAGAAAAAASSETPASAASPAPSEAAAAGAPAGKAPVAGAPTGTVPVAGTPTATAPGELLLKDLPRTRGLCSALGDLRATEKALVYLPTRVTQVCEDFLSSAAFEAPWKEIDEICFEYAISGTVTLKLKNGHDYSLKDKQTVIEGLEKRLKELHPELAFKCD